MVGSRLTKSTVGVRNRVFVISKETYFSEFSVYKCKSDRFSKC
jgi:hypothetical protein